MGVSHPNMSSRCFPAYAKRIGRSHASCGRPAEALRDILIGQGCCQIATREEGCVAGASSIDKTDERTTVRYCLSTADVPFGVQIRRKTDGHRQYEITRQPL